MAQAAAILEQVKAKCFTEEQKERAEYLFDRYAKTLAEATNKENEIGTRCPSVMICGAGNFPVRKKEKQIKAFEANRENWRKAEHYLDQLKRAHTLAVKDSDPEVLDFLRAKLAGLEAGHELMISANAYYRKHKTLDGFEGIPEKTLAWITKPGVYMAGGRNGDGSPLAFHGKPFPAYELTSSKATIKRVQARIAKIEAAKAAAPVEDERDDYTYKEDQESMRVQLPRQARRRNPRRTQAQRFSLVAPQRRMAAATKRRWQVCRTPGHGISGRQRITKTTDTPAGPHRTKSGPAPARKGHNKTTLEVSLYGATKMVF